MQRRNEKDGSGKRKAIGKKAVEQINDAEMPTVAENLAGASSGTLPKTKATIAEAIELARGGDVVAANRLTAQHQLDIDRPYGATFSSTLF